MQPNPLRRVAEKFETLPEYIYYNTSFYFSFLSKDRDSVTVLAQVTQEPKLAPASYSTSRSTPTSLSYPRGPSPRRNTEIFPDALLSKCSSPRNRYWPHRRPRRGGRRRREKEA